MKRIYFLLPCLAVAAFAGYYRQWETARDEPATYCREDFTDPYRHRDGRKEAESDLAHGKLRVVSFGLPAHWSGEYREILLHDYHIEHHAIAGCVVSEGILRYAAAYNQVMAQRIQALYGTHVFDDAAAKAATLYTERHPPSIRD